MMDKRDLLRGGAVAAGEQFSLSFTGELPPGLGMACTRWRTMAVKPSFSA